MTQSSTPPEIIPGYSLLGRGYVIYGPSLPAADSSYYRNPIVAPSKQMSDQTISYDGKQTVFSVPDNITLDIDTSSSTTAIAGSTMQQFTSEEAIELGISGSFGAFSAGFSASFNTKNTFNQDTRFAQVNSDITIYNLSYPKSPTPVDEFATDVKALDGKSWQKDAQDFYGFFSKWGTHYVAQVYGGGQYSLKVQTVEGVSTSISTQEYKENASLALEASLSAEGSQKWKDVSETFTENSLMQVSTIGGSAGQIPSGKLSRGASFASDYKLWSQTLLEDAAPVKLMYSGVWELVEDASIRENLQNAYQSLLSHQLQLSLNPVQNMDGSTVIVKLNDQDLFPETLAGQGFFAVSIDCSKFGEPISESAATITTPVTSVDGYPQAWDTLAKWLTENVGSEKQKIAIFGTYGTFLPQQAFPSQNLESILTQLGASLTPSAPLSRSFSYGDLGNWRQLHPGGPGTLGDVKMAATSAATANNFLTSYVLVGRDDLPAGDTAISNASNARRGPRKTSS